MIRDYEEKEGLTVTFNTTEDCNLRCKYCYEINKCAKSMKLEDAKRYIDLILTTEDITNCKDDPDPTFRGLYQKGIILDFIGGDSLIDPEFIDQVLTYWQYKVNTVDTPNAKIWRNSWRASISSNGTLFYREDVRNFMEKWHDNLSVGVSVDGCPEIHDMNRIFPDGSGSMAKIVEWWPWYVDYCYGYPMIKATCNKDSIYYICKSVKYLHEDLGIKVINMNFIMENMYLEQKDLDELEKQLKELVDYVFEHRDDLYMQFFDYNEFYNHHLSTGDDWNCKGRCGSGAMPALGLDGNIYPCFRWLHHTQEKGRDPLIVGNLKDGFNHKENFTKVREGAYKCNCTREEKCRTCEYESACAYCIGGCYSEFGDFIRSTHICEVTKLLCKYAHVYWDKVFAVDGKEKYYWLNIANN